jgi:hypothetical protein
VGSKRLLSPIDKLISALLAGFLRRGNSVLTHLTTALLFDFELILQQLDHSTQQDMAVSGVSAGYKSLGLCLPLLAA